jgi:hypothetical protein
LSDAIKLFWLESKLISGVLKISEEVSEILRFSKRVDFNFLLESYRNFVKRKRFRWIHENPTLNL